MKKVRMNINNQEIIYDDKTNYSDTFCQNCGGENILNDFKRCPYCGIEFVWKIVPEKQYEAEKILQQILKEINDPKTKNALFKINVIEEKIERYFDKYKIAAPRKQ